MRASRSVFAALLAAVLITACKGDKITVRQNVDITLLGTTIGTADTTIGNCTYNLRVVTGGNVSAGGYTLRLNESRDNFAQISSNCPVEQVFDWASSDPTRVEVDEVNDFTGRTTGNNIGSAMITVEWEMDRGIKFFFLVTVVGDQGGTNPSMNAIGPFSTGNGCSLTFQGSLSNPSGVAGTWSVSNFAGGLTGVSVNASTGAGTLSQNTSGSFQLIFTPSNSAIPAVHTTVVVANTNCTNPTTPGITVPGNINLNGGNGCPMTQSVSITVTNLANAGINVSSSNTGLFTVSGSSSTSGTTTTWTGTITRVAGAIGSGNLNVTVDNQSGLSRSIPVAVSATDCVAPAPIVTFNPSSVCFSMQAGQATSVQVAVNVQGATMANLVFTSTLSGVTFSVSGNTLTVTRSGAFSARTDGQIWVAHSSNPNVPVGSLPIQIYTTLCPGQGSSISYSPSGGSFDGTQTLNANCVRGSTDPECDPFWTSSDPSRITVRGNTARVINGVTFWTGTTATLTEIASGTAEICVQWSITQTSPRFCSTKTAQ